MKNAGKFLWGMAILTLVVTAFLAILPAILPDRRVYDSDGTYKTTRAY